MITNMDIAGFTIARRCANRGSFVARRSVQNRHKESLWAKVNRVLSALYTDVFEFLQERMLLDSLNKVHLFALHFVYLPPIGLATKFPPFF